MQEERCKVALDLDRVVLYLLGLLIFTCSSERGESGVWGSGVWWPGATGQVRCCFPLRAWTVRMHVLHH